ncbi:MAG: cydD, partial [Phenylobacterium sp.]|nr:cydD [Phenylobacterium sp.]
MPPFQSRFWSKFALAVGLVALADGLTYDSTPGAGLGLLALALAGVAWIAHPPVRRRRLAGLALLIAAALALFQIERASLMAMLLYAIALGVAVLAPRARSGDDVWRWWQRLAMAALKAIPGPFKDVDRLLKIRGRRRTLRITAVMLAAVLPVVGGLVFLSLFAAANPVISETLAALRFPEPDVARLIFWALAAGVAWTVLRPRGFRRARGAPGMEGELNLPGVTTASVTVSLLVFNAIFALQNGLDVAFLWSGAPLPKGMTLAGYAHRGAYPLIATALLAGLFVLVFLRPGSATGRARWPRLLVTVWVAQNLLLVASTALRTLDYVQVYSLTRLRIAALAWMLLVAVGLALICWRLLRGKSSSWLINANALAAGMVLVACSFVDLGAIAASWNVAHAREVGGPGQPLDL